MNKRLFFLVLVFLMMNLYVYASPIVESDIPMPEVQYDLADRMIGEFLEISHMGNRRLIIFPNNKFISIVRDYDTDDRYGYGYIRLKNSRWYLSVSKEPTITGRKPNWFFYNDLVEIFLTDTGFYCYDSNYSDSPIVFTRYTFLPDETRTAKEFTIPFTRITSQYFILPMEDSEIIVDYNEIKWPDKFPPAVYHSLGIEDGQTVISRSYLISNERGEHHILLHTWEGFIEITDRVEDDTQGIIRFTNGTPYYYIEGGTAQIEIADGKTTITMQCTEAIEDIIREQLPDIKSPVYMVLEF